MQKFKCRLLTCLLLSAIMLCVGCDERPEKSLSKPNARHRAGFSTHGIEVEMYEVVIDGKYYLVTTYYHGVSVIPMDKQPKAAERE